jgi:hypothetical protein
LAHEYLPIFEKPLSPLPSEGFPLRFEFKEEGDVRGPIEATTVWIFKEEELEERVRANLAARFAGSLAFEAEDIRLGGRLCPMALKLWESLRCEPDLRLREIVIVVPEEKLLRPKSGEFLEIIHRYLLIYQIGR